MIDPIIQSEMLSLIRALADNYTGREMMMYTDPGEWAEEILASHENREPQEP